MNPQRPTWLEIELGAITNNVQQLRRRVDPDCILMSVVKANAYGHGAVEVAKTALIAGATRLAVATLSEAIELRNATITAPILVLGYILPYMADVAVEMDITLTVYDLKLAKALNDAACTYSKKAIAHVKVNTGMNRLGISLHQSTEFVSALVAFQHLQVEGIYTHFATADEDDQRFTLEQFSRFQKMLSNLEAMNLRPPIAHTANSAATLTLPQTHLNMVRPGIAMYGLHPDPNSNRLPEGFKPALTWKALIAHINHLVAGETVSYGREFQADAPASIAVIPVGYADGFPRKPQHWKHVLVAGKVAPVVGRVCMDQTMINVSSHYSLDISATHADKQHPAIRQGDEVILIGKQGDICLTVEDIAQQIGTNNYDVVSRILSRVPRIYK